MTSKNSKKVTLLAVDDDPQMLRLVELYLPQEDYEITTATSGRRALDILQKKRYDLILLDMQMPHIDGLQLLTTIKTELKLHAPVVMATAHGVNEVTQAVVEKGAYDLIQKPYTADRLKLTLRNAYRYKVLRESYFLLRNRLEKERVDK